MEIKKAIADKIARTMNAAAVHDWKNIFHLEMPFGLINDPNGLSFYQGKYYIFYQWNPFGCEHRTKHWGMVTTEDFIHYSRPEIALAPDAAFDRNGCYSGCAQVEDGRLQLFYTGNVKNAQGERESYQCLATMGADGIFHKDGVVIQAQPPGYTAHFRDPYLFTVDGALYMIIGGQTESLQGCALVYCRQEDRTWNFAGALQTDLPNFGYMWECPNIVKLSEEQYAFIFSPQGLPAEEYRYLNRYQSGYVIGRLDMDDLSLRHDAFEELDQGFDFYAPQIFCHDGRHILFGWAGMPDQEADYPTSAAGWLYSLTLPREVKYQNGRLYQLPVKELENLRINKMDFSGKVPSDTFDFAAMPRNVEIGLAIDLLAAKQVEICFQFGAERIVLSYDSMKQEVCLDRAAMQLGGGGVRRLSLDIKSLWSLRIFIDRSIIEIYYQNGEQVTTLTYFPQQEAAALQMKINGDAAIELRECNVWELTGMVYE